MSKKLFIGPKLRRLREQHHLKQTQCAERLGLSHSYLNQLENNQRPVTAAVLIKLSTAFSINISHFSDDGDEQLAADINLALKDQVMVENGIQWQDIQSFVEHQPELAANFNQLYRGYVRLREDYEQLVTRFYGEQHTAHLLPLPHEEVRDFFYRQNNHIDVLDQAAEALFEQRNFVTGQQLYLCLQDYMRKELGITVEITVAQPAAMKTAIKSFNPEKQLMTLSSKLRRSQQCFQMASQIALIVYNDVLDELCNSAGFSGEQAQKLGRIGLANYFAGALLMPYQHFLLAAEKSRYDIEALQNQFYVSAEQVCHRLSTLQRQGGRGVPFYFVRVDQAGNISKRQSATSFHFARTGGACPLWNVHDAFSSPQHVLTQIAQMPDGQLYFCIARHIAHSGGSHHALGKQFAIGLGCELEHAHRLVYSDGLDLQNLSMITPIGPGCRVCSRQNCTQRAFPPAGKLLNIDVNVQLQEPYGFNEPATL